MIKNVKIENIVRKEFSYSKGEVILNFKLRIDIKEELKNFTDCLESALLEIKKEIEK